VCWISDPSAWVKVFDEENLPTHDTGSDTGGDHARIIAR
jgi:hypothetical protein